MADWTAHLPRDRPTSRILVIDERDRLLLLRANNDDRPEEFFWFSPGGGVEPGESYEEGARRELWEETGLTVPSVGPCVWHRDREFRGVQFRERYFVVHTEAFDPEPADPDPRWEQYLLREGWYRWWTHEELLVYDGPDRILPPAIQTMLAPILERRFPSEPLLLDR